MSALRVYLVMAVYGIAVAAVAVHVGLTVALALSAAVGVCAGFVHDEVVA